MALIPSPNSCSNTLKRQRCSSSRRRSHHASIFIACRRSSKRVLACSKSSKVLNGKLEALKNLIPSSSNAETVKAEQLFRETADYIVLLRAKIVVLQRLIEFYGSNEDGNTIDV